MDRSTAYPFDRPIIILAAPRSGSTLLFETLVQSGDVWSIGDESHEVFENIAEFNPLQGCDSNRLTVADAKPENVSTIRSTFYRSLVDRDGNGFNAAGSETRPRLLEKTPKNSLRISLLNEIFPDAIYIYLYRNPRENISSIMDAWESGGFVTYRDLPGWGGDWSLLLPHGWRTFRGKSLEKIAAFQWRSANEAIINGLKNTGRSRWMALSYGQLIDEQRDTISRICEFCGISFDERLASVCDQKLSLSKYTVSPPSTTKWHKNAASLKKVVPGMKSTLKIIADACPDIPAGDFDSEIDPSIVKKNGDARGVGRNAPCPCGSGKKYKRCHGAG